MDKTMDMLLDERREQRRLEHEKARKRDEGRAGRE